MKATDLVSKVANFMIEDKDVFVCIYTRDKFGCVTSTQEIPINDAFAHEKGTVKLCAENPDNPELT